MIDETHDASVRSWVHSANGHPDFPLQNLPLGMFRRGSEPARCGVAIGDHILDLAALAETFPSPLSAALLQPSLNTLLGQPPSARRQLRALLFDLLRAESIHIGALETMLHERSACEMMLPARIGGYTDFYAGIIHATNIGTQFRPESPLLANYRHLPIGYHGRTSSIRPSGTSVRRPNGQIMTGNETPEFTATRRLDFEVELGLWVAEGNSQGEPIPVGEAGERIAGVTLLNDWSARDIQVWEYQPLGPFLAKNFSSTVSPWLVTMEALAPFRVPHRMRSPEHPPLLPYLLAASDQEHGALAITIDVELQTEKMRKDGIDPQRICRTSAQHLYWTPAQLLAHHTSNGCNLEPGDLLGTGTISSPEATGFGSLMEISDGGSRPLKLIGGEERGYLHDGDEVVLTGRCERDGFATIGFGECRALVLPALPLD